MGFTASNTSAILAHVPTSVWMQSVNLEIFPRLNRQWGAGSKASDSGSTKRRLRFHQLEERKDGRVTADPLLPWEGIFSSSVEVTLVSGPISTSPGPSPECGTSSFNCSHADCNVGWKRLKENICLFKTGGYTHQNRPGFPLIRERRAKN